jgi:hypothetical protein
MLFAFHAAKVLLLLEVSTPHRLLVSLDATGTVAVWESDTGLCLHHVHLSVDKGNAVAAACGKFLADAGKLARQKLAMLHIYCSSCELA